MTKIFKNRYPAFMTGSDEVIIEFETTEELLSNKWFDYHREKAVKLYVETLDDGKEVVCIDKGSWKQRIGHIYEKEEVLITRTMPSIEEKHLYDNIAQSYIDMKES